MHDVTELRFAPTRAFLRSDRAKIVAVIIAVIGSGLLVFGVPGLQSFLPYRIDLDVYRLGGEVLLSGGDLYGRLPDTAAQVNLPFTYPPIAAVIFAPISMLPYWMASLLFSVGTLACLYVVLRIVVKDLSDLQGRDISWLAFGAFAIMMWLGPVVETISYGQVNVFLMTLVVVDIVVGRGKWWQGSLIGLAMAIKLTPAVFLAYFLIRRDWRALVVSIASAAVYTGLGFLFTWSDSVTYWTDTVVDPGRIGGLAYVSNQSINGFLTRLGLGDATSIVWFTVCAVIGIASLFLMARLFRFGHSAAAMMVMAFYSLLASPVSWSHHWVWVAPAIVLLVIWAERVGSRWLWGVAIAGGAIFFSRLVWFMPQEDGRELAWSWWQHILGNAQTLWGIAFLIMLAVFASRATPHALTRPVEE